MRKFKLVSDYVPAGDQPQAIDELTEGVLRGDKHQVLLGVSRLRQDLHIMSRHGGGPCNAEEPPPLY